jgi:DeoR/GlpR family transcriptional regulator of sugar metabolism
MRSINTSKAARWLGVSERTVRRLCEAQRLKGSYQFSHYGHWLIPVSALEAFKPCPEDLHTEIMSALSESKTSSEKR